MYSEYPVTGSTTKLYFECDVKFTIPFTTVVPNGGITTSFMVHILPFFLQHHIQEHHDFQ